jgi:hypothetical protein
MRLSENFSLGSIRKMKLAGVVLLFAGGASFMTAQVEQAPPPAPQQQPQQTYPQQPPPQPYPQQQQYPQYPQQQYPQQPYPQQPYPAQAPPMLSLQQLDQLVGPIALYPDSLLAQVLTASTYWNDIPAAASWADQHAYLHGEQLAQAIQADNLPWDPSILALLPFPSVLDQMARDMGWTQQLGNAVLEERPQVMDAIQAMRQQAYNYGYLRSDPYVRVVPNPGYIEIYPVNPAVVYVPVYNPRVVYVPPRPGFYVSGAIHFGPAVTVGAFFAPWGWRNPGFAWREHNIIIDQHPWVRTWNNRRSYAHPYAAPHPAPPGPRVERHDIRHEEHGHDHDHGRDHH